MSETLNHVAQADREHYEQHGYVLLRGVLPATLLEACRGVLERWVDQMAEFWREQGRITDLREGLDFEHRFATLWQDAGRPPHHRSPRAPLVRLAPREVFTILRDPALLDAAEGLLGTGELISHGVWNSRPKCPESRFTDTPMHQDAQYFRNEFNTGVMSAWFPLHAVDENRSCLMVTPDTSTEKLYDNSEDADTGFVGISKPEAEPLERVPIPMQPGDLLCFKETTPHGAMPNRTDKMRWSIDMRFVPTRTAHPDALQTGFVARSADAASLTSYDEWHAKWADPKLY